MSGEFVLLLERDILVSEEHGTSLLPAISATARTSEGMTAYLCHEEGELVLLGVAELTELDSD